MKITIITPTFNSEKTILDTLDSVSSQTYHNIEHLIIDGGSKDQTKNLIKSYNKKNIRFFKKKTNIYEAINYGIKKSKGSII
ncbi:glycosyltransferase, partial [Candidatus Pelagibacter sp.]|nr:glycosyltransferase [Candidatus Pelagibacter sp.]